MPPIVKWTLNFGDGTAPVSIDTAPTTVDDSGDAEWDVPYTYANDGIYLVSATAMAPIYTSAIAPVAVQTLVYTPEDEPLTSFELPATPGGRYAGNRPNAPGISDFI